MKHSFYEFFSGGGMARAGLGSQWNCLFANDIDTKKGSSYSANWKDNVLLIRDVGLVSTSDLPSTADLIWASFPCQDLSLAGMGAGLKGSRSGTFWPFWKLVSQLRREGRHPSVVVLENVCGALTSHKGHDFQSLMSALRLEGYRAGAIVADASLFLPHSRPRLFIIGVREDLTIDDSMTACSPQLPFHNAALISAYKSLPTIDQAKWIWWKLETPSQRITTLADLIEEDVSWHTPAQTRTLLNMMTPVNLAKVAAAKKMGRTIIGAVYKRTRVANDGTRKQRAEVRFDDIAGCLRTPGGGSSRQSILVIQGNQVKSRLLSPRETARLMGLPDSYQLPENRNEAYHLTGDGLAVPVVSHISRYILEPLIKNNKARAEFAA
jgi:DNA (cytosine-5)-methyltransferase 1